MSRLFDALKGASGFRQGADGDAGSGVWDALGINGDSEPALNDPDASDQASVPVNGGLISRVFPAQIKKEVPPAHLPPLNASVAMPANTTLDRRARLIPHAVNPSVAEHYRRLRTKIMQQQAEKHFRSLVITSANPQEGKTVTVLNLAMSFSMLPNFKVLVVDGDLRRGTLGHLLGMDDHEYRGLSNLIDGSAQLEDVLLKSDEVPMHFVIRGNSQVYDLHSSQLDTNFSRMTELYDLVLVDTPPVNLMADVQLLAGACDAVLLLARAFSTTKQAFEKAVEELSRFRVIGTVLNAGEAQTYGYSGDY
jgi:capsular exopolysaccharide synthesis family protein